MRDERSKEPSSHRPLPGRGFSFQIVIANAVKQSIT
ncbi:MAG: hypothetical protein RLY97_1080 [Pseudomonadota bacterium]